ncbi:MAG TPA: HlyD family efflux transporter periplasmic adaptor subunit, partial [Polyangiaceae bacterium]
LSGREEPAVAGLFPRDTALAEVLFRAARQSLDQTGRSVATVPGGADQIIVWPVVAAGRVLGIGAFVLPATDDAALFARRVGAIEARAGALEARLYRLEASRLNEQWLRQSFVLEGFDAVLGEPKFPRAALAFVNFVARRFGAERAVYGLVHDGDVAIECQSDTSHYVAKVNTMSVTRLAMQEAADQLEAVLVPAVAGRNPVNRAHQEMADAIGHVAVLSIPLVDAELCCYGVLLLERAAGSPFADSDVRQLEALGNVVGRVLEDRRRSQQPVHRLLALSLRRFFETFLRPGYLRRKVALLVVIAAIVFFAFARGDYRPGGEIVLEGEELRAVIAPFDGFLESATARAGDELSAGDVLATLDTRELRLERLRWLADEARARRQYEDALSRQDRAQVQIHTAEIERAQAELGLLDYQIARAELSTPFAATVVDGDLSQRIGSAVRQGDKLFELAPLERYRIAMFVNEFVVGDIAVGQQGTAVLSALPGRELAIEVVRITPVAEVRDGETVFRVEAALLDESDPELRPGL